MTTRITYTTGDRSPALDAAFEEALARARSSGGDPRPHLVGGREVSEGPVFEREDPAHSSVVASRAHEGGSSVVAEAIRAARAAAAEWRRLPFEERCSYLRAVAARLAERRMELAAEITLETGKVRTESVAEVEEAIDLIETYCRQMEEHDGYERPLGQLAPDERNRSVLRPYGVFGVIAPFNFPLALALGMSTGALAAGNTVVLKPSEETPGTGDALAQAMLDVGLPAGVFNLVQGGGDTGAALVDATDGIAFTGSAQVGLSIARRLAGGSFTRPLIAEMGGKNPTIVTSSADLDAAAEGVARAAFGFSGQKCSACSRAIVSKEVYVDFLDRLAAIAASMRVGDPIDRDVALGPVIDRAAMARFEAAVEETAKHGRIVAGGEAAGAEGYFVSPTVIADLPIGHWLTREELFVPLIAVTSASSLDEALAEANAVEYGLTAGIFSGDEDEVDRFLDEIEAGILYVNRRAGATTGAWPGIQSFCGWKSSGVTGKGGLGPYYVQQFMREQSRTVVDA